MKAKTVGVISLGCDKNRVDTEKMLALLSKRYTITNDIEQAEIIIINTCAFIESARKEAFEEIFSAVQYKIKGVAEKIIVTGCLSQRFIKDIWEGIPEVDAFLGVSDYCNLLSVIDEIYSGKRINAVQKPKNEKLIDRVLTTKDYAYLKIADGCSNCCSYCMIPSIRGAYRSIEKELLIEEAKSLGKVRELILVAQDTTKYGEDLEPKSSLPDLIRSLSALPNVLGIRLLYCYPENVTEELIREFQGNAKMIRYIDIPFQHADDVVLKKMNRKGTFDGYLNLVEKLKREINGIAIRSTFMTGFPFETEQAFENLVEFLKKAKLFNAGFFKFSREKGTASYNFQEQVPALIKNKRLKKLYAVQKQVVKENYKRLEGKIFKVFVEGLTEKNSYYGRAYFNAPEIDGRIYFYSNEQCIIGQTYDVVIKGFSDYDLYGERL